MFRWPPRERPKLENDSTLGNFEDWSSWIRNSLIWLGHADPVDTMDQVRADDPELDRLSTVLVDWAHIVGAEEVTAAVAIAKANSGIEEKNDDNGDRRWRYHHPEFRQALLAVAGVNGRIDPTKLGYWLRRNRDRQVGDHKFVRGSDSHKTARWAVSGTF
jgi:hypothetical protein